ncbi:MAG: pilus assembly protein PilM [Planctomycetota bacterium]
MIFNKDAKMQLAGMDIGVTSVKLVKLARSGQGYSVEGAGYAEIANGSGKADDEAVISAINECFEKAGCDSRSVVCGLRGEDVIVRNFTFPPIPKEDIYAAVLLEAEQISPMDIHKSTVDFQVISSAGRQPEDRNVKGILVIAANEAIRKKVELVSQAGCKCVFMDVNALAVLNCFTECENPQEAGSTAIIDMGHTFTTISILASDGIPLVRGFPIAGSYIAKKFGERKEGESSVDLNDNEIDIEDSLDKTYRKLLGAIDETLLYYTTQHQQSATIDKVLFCGGLSLSKELVSVLKNHLAAKVVIWNPFDYMSYQSDIPGAELLSSKGSILAAAAGLAMRTV